MMKLVNYTLLAISLFLVSCKSDTQKSSATQKKAPKNSIVPIVSNEIDIQPVTHGTMVLTWNNKTIYIDPVGGVALFKTYQSPDLILITDIHGDHLNIETLIGITKKETKIIVPQSVAVKLPEELASQIYIVNNGEIKEFIGFNIEAIPMYNLREEALKFHEKGRGNGYVISYNKKRVYVSGDTEDIPEMRSLKDIDIAFVCMNLPYTMTPESAADAVLEFTPKTVYPYHYRGTKGLSDVSKFKSIIESKNKNIHVIQLDWYTQ